RHRAGKFRQRHDQHDQGGQGIRLGRFRREDRADQPRSAVRRATGRAQRGCGMFLPLPWYPGATGEKGLAYSKEFQKRQGTPAPYLFVGLYSAVRTYLLAAQATKTDNPKLIFDYMHAHVIDDAFTKHGVLRPDGRMVHDVYLMQ